jgi:predicted chitinase
MAIPKNPFGSSIAEGPVDQSSRNDNRGTQPTSGTTFQNLNEKQKANAIYLYNTLLSYGFTDIEARAALGVVAKESNFIPKNEFGYGGTKYSRLVTIWPWLGKLYPPNKASELEALAKNNVKFYDLVYGVGKRNPKGLYGNTSVGDGYKYRGRGFNQLTFKGSYEQFNKLYADQGSKAGKVDIVANPDLLNQEEGGIYKIAAHFAALFFLKNRSSLSRPQTQDAANFTYVRFNAGLGTSTKGAIFQEGLGKVNFFVSNLPEKIA